MEEGRWKIVLASNSPRRKELLAGLDLDFQVRIIDGIDESYPADLPTRQIAEYISQKKAAAYRETMAADELVITADTIVVLGDEVMGKPHDEADACRMLRALSGQTHHVITGVTLTTLERQQSFSVLTDVTFKTLSDDEINPLLCHPLPSLRQGWLLRHPGVDRLYRCHCPSWQLLQCHGSPRPAHLRSPPHVLECNL